MSPEQPRSVARKAVPGEQRIFSLILALVTAPAGLTKGDLLSSVYGYSDRYDGGESPSLDRQFERDKDTLRELGVPLEVIDSPGEPGNNQKTRYRIAKERLQLPADLRFTSDEIALLRLASLAWQQGSLSAESRRATMKLAALGATVDERHLGVAPSLGSAHPASPALQAAINSQKIVTFDYRIPVRPEALQRRVAPLGLHRAEGRWHLIAYDLERESTRTFLLDRIQGEVRTTRSAFDPELRELVPAQRDAFDALLRTQRATLEVAPGSEAAARLSPRGQLASEGTLDIGFLDESLFAEELLSYGADVTVLGPASLRDLMTASLRAMLSLHPEHLGQETL